MDSGVQSNYDAQFGKYILIAKLATGGMGEIFLAKLSGMAGFEKLVVIKRLLPHLAEDAHFVTMLMDEARIAARLSHPNVCQVYDLGEVAGVFYIAMEFLEGVPCSQLLKIARRNEALIDIGLAANVLQQTCAGLHHAHSLRDHKGNDIGLVHRDVSPSNLFATISGTIKVLDFGVAKSQDARARTHTGALKGKYAYMSPEQVMAHDIDRRSDVFSLGIVLFELLTTRRLFWRDSEYKMFQAIAEDDIPDVRDFRPDVPDALAEVVNTALSRNVEGRYATAEAMGAAVGAAMSLSSGTAPNSAVAAYVTSNFDKQIRERRELVVTAVSPHNQITVADGRDDMGEHSRELALLDAPEIVVEDSPDNLEDLLGDLAAEKRPAKSRGLGFFAGLAMIGVLAAVAGSFLLGMLNGDDEARAGDVVIQTKETKIPKAEETKDDKSGELVPLDSKQPPEPKKEIDVDVRGSSEFYARRFRQQQGGAMKGCIRKHPKVSGSGTQVDVVMTVELDGRISKVVLPSPAVRRSPLGKCIARVAKRTKFPKPHGRIEVTIPVGITIMQ